MATVSSPFRADRLFSLAGVGIALAVVAVLWIVFTTRPSLGFFLLLGAGFLGAGGIYLFTQRRQTLHSAQGIGKDRYQRGAAGGVFGAWIAEDDGEGGNRRRGVAVAIVSFFVTLFVASFGVILFGEPIATRLATLGI